VFSSSPAECLGPQTVRLTPPTPMWFTGRWSWNAADDCSSVLVLRCVWRSGCLGIDRILPGLALGSVTRPERTFEVFRETSLPPHIAVKSAIDPLFGSTSELPSAAPLGSRRAPLMGLDQGKPACTGTSALRPSIDRPFRGSSREVTVRVHSRMRSKLLILRPRDANPEVMFRPRGFAPPRRLSPRDGSRACCIPLPTMGFVTFPALQPEDLRAPRDATTPRRTPPTRRGLPGHPVPWPP